MIGLKLGAKGLRASPLAIPLILVVLALLAAAVFQRGHPGLQAPTNLTAPSRASPSPSAVRIVVLVDNEALDPRLRTAWGLSVYVETPHARILFDAGPDPKLLELNAMILGVNLSSLDLVVLSHEHGDHVLGLAALRGSRLTVYVPRGSAPSLTSWLRSVGFKVVAVNDTLRVAPMVYIVGPLYGPPYEQALAVNTSRGLVLLVGCSHPGVDAMVLRALKDLKTKVYAVIGGFHMVGAPLDRVKRVADALVSLGVEKIYPLHCSGDLVRSYLARAYPERYGDGGAGLQLVFESSR